MCQSERSCSSLGDKVDMWLKLPTLCEIGELVIAVEVSCSPSNQSGNCVTSDCIVVADAVDKGRAECVS